MEAATTCNVPSANITFAGCASGVKTKFLKEKSLDFFLDWKTHGSEYYECSRYKENPQIAQEANHLKGLAIGPIPYRPNEPSFNTPIFFFSARRALERYLFYYERFENHHKSLKLEEELRAKIKAKIEEKVHNHEDTWIDWQYLHDAATLLTKCRYTLQTFSTPIPSHTIWTHRRKRNSSVRKG